MTYHKLFNCQKCDAEIEVNDPTHETRVRCRRCGGSYRLVYNEQALSWLLRAEQPVEPDSDVRPEDAPFSVLAEASRPAPDDRSEQHREQTDRHPGEEAVARRPASKPDKP